MIIIAMMIFAFCSWAVFSHRFDDGILVKNILSFAAIFSFLAILDPWNHLAVYSALTLLVIGFALWYYGYYRPLINARAHQRERLNHR